MYRKWFGCQGLSLSHNIIMTVVKFSAAVDYGG